MAETLEQPIGMVAKPTRPQEFYDSVKQKFAEERDLRLSYRPEGPAQYTSDLSGELSRYEVDPYAGEVTPREPINDTVEVLFIGGGFSALLTSARLREHGVESIRIVERGADVGGTWYWNRYPGVACDVVAYDYLPLLDELDYVPKDHYARGPEIFAHCQAIARKYNLYELATFQTTVTSTTWDPVERMWNLTTDRGDRMKARFVISPTALSPSRSSRRSTASKRSGDIPFTPRDGITHTPSRISRAWKIRSLASSGPGRLRCRRFLDWAPRPKSCTFSNALRRRLISATIGRPIPTGRGD